MSVLQRKELEDSPLADLHAIASELAIDGYRTLRKKELIGAILIAQGAVEEDDEGARAERDDAERAGEVEDRPEAEAAEGDVDGEPEAEVEAERGAAEDTEQSAAKEEQERERASGVLDVLPNGSGFLRRDGDEPAVYVSQAQIRRCELRGGDEVAGPLRPARRNERHPSLVRVETVNGRDAEPPEQRPLFEELAAVHATERLAAPDALGDLPLAKGARVAIAGPAGAGASHLLREIVAMLDAKEQGLELAVVLVGVRPEEETDWRRALSVPVRGGSFDGSAEEQAQAARLAVERAKRIAERGGDAVVAIDSLADLDAATARRVFGAGRRLEQGGSLTVVAVVGGDDATQLRRATTRVVLEPR